MALTDPTSTQQPDDTQQDPFEGLDTAKQLVDQLGTCALQTADAASGSCGGSAEDAKNYAQASLFATQALTALLAYMNPDSPNAPGDNPAKKGD